MCVSSRLDSYSYLTRSPPFQAYDARLAALLAAKNDRTDEHKRAQERYRKVGTVLSLSLTRFFLGRSSLALVLIAVPVAGE